MLFHRCKTLRKNIIVENERKRVKFLMLKTLIKTLTTLCSHNVRHNHVQETSFRKFDVFARRFILGYVAECYLLECIHWVNN